MFFFFPEIGWGPVQPLLICLERVGDSGKVFADFSQKRWVYMGVCGENTSDVLNLSVIDTPLTDY